MDTRSGLEAAREMGIAHPGPAALQILERGSVGEAVAGAGAAVLGILGLVGLLPQTLCAIGVIVVGVALLLGGAAVVARHKEFMSGAAGPRTAGGAMEIVAFSGVGSIVLGILALFMVTPLTLLPIAALVGGATLLLVSSAMGQFNTVIQKQPAADNRADLAVRGAGGFDAIVGIGAVVLGILGLSGSNAVTLTLVATLAIGVAVLLSGSSLASRIYRIFG